MTKATRALPMAVVGGLAAGGIALWAAGRAWSTTVHDRPAPLPPEETVTTGMTVAPWVAPAAVVLAATALAVVAVGGRLRRVVAAVAVLSGTATAAGGVAGLVDAPGVWPAVVLAAGALGLTIGAWTWRRGAAWPRMSARYDRAGRPAAVSDDPAALWDALDRGIDPSTSIGRSAPGEEYAR